MLRDGLPVPDTFDGTIPEGAAVLVARPAGAGESGPTGVAVLTGSTPALTLEHLWVRPETHDLAREVVDLVRARAARLGASVLTVEVRSDDQLMSALATGTRVLGELMAKPLPTDVAPPAALTWRAMSPTEFSGWQERQVHAYAEDNLERSGGDPARALERSRRDVQRFLPDGLATPDTTLVVLTTGGGAVGHLWLRHHREPGVSFVYDVEVAERHRGRGLGRAAMVVAEVFTRQAGDDTLKLHVFGGNDVARGLYVSQGFVVQSTRHNLLARA